MKSWFSPLLYLLASSSEGDLRRHIEFLKAENEMLRKRVPKKHIFLDDDERERLLKLGEAIGSGVSKLITIVHPRTYQRWLRRKSLGQKPTKKMGRTKTPESIKDIIIRIAKETGWGYGRIVGELHKLRILGVGRTTVGTILKEDGVKPSPKRGKGTWDEFIKIHSETLWQVDFFSKMVVTRKGIKHAFVLAFLNVKTRRVFCSPCTFKPDSKWMAKQARFTGGGTLQQISMEWEDPRLIWAVREPFASRHSQATLVADFLEQGDELVIGSQMPTNGVIFSDGIESDFLEFNSGTIARFTASGQRANLVVS